MPACAVRQPARRPEARRAKKKQALERDGRTSTRSRLCPATSQDKKFHHEGAARPRARQPASLRVAEYYYIRIGARARARASCRAPPRSALGVVGALLGYFLPRIWVGRRIGSRLDAFNKQLPDTITLLSNSLRAGSSFLQSIELVSRESPAPMGAEMGRVVREVNLGLSMEEALANLVRRIE